tara:strand:+ start:460 stop:723 length:264 start_codon:yes stop_codon:yes gene_type:complete
MSDSNLNSFYERIEKATREEGVLDPTGKSVVLFRVAIENGAATIGLASILHVMSKILSSVLAISASDDDQNEEDFLKNFDPDDPIKH